VDNKSLFNACLSQCVWCQEQWPTIMHKGEIVHVAPYTKDPKLFCWGCQSASIRKAFGYMGYVGGKQIKWKVPSVSVIKTTAIRPDTRDFWRNCAEASLNVASWPEWKRSIDADGKRAKPATAEDLKRLRGELLQYDALDYWSRQPCTDNLQFRPGYALGGVFQQPSCNYGIGCTTCWGRYEEFYKEKSKGWCD
jgi:hypothetical protein